MSQSPQPGDIWAHKHNGRRVRVMRIWSGGSIALRTVVLIGNEWQAKQGSCASTISPAGFALKFRPLLTGPAGVA